MRVAAAFCLQAFAILILGAGLCRLFAPRRPLSWSLAVPFGFLGLFTLTEVLALPLTLLQVPLSVFTFLLTACLLAAAAVILVRRRTDIKAMFVRLPRLIKAHGAAGLRPLPRSSSGSPLSTWTTVSTPAITWARRRQTPGRTGWGCTSPPQEQPCGR